MHGRLSRGILSLCVAQRRSGEALGLIYAPAPKLHCIYTVGNASLWTPRGTLGQSLSEMYLYVTVMQTTINQLVYLFAERAPVLGPDQGKAERKSCEMCSSAKLLQ